MTLNNACYFLAAVILVSATMSSVETHICQYDEMSSGRWIYMNDSSSRKSFRCCGGDGNDWKDPSLAGFCNANETLLTSGRGCFCDELFNTRHSVSEREKFVWKTDNCTTMEWNATYFCDLLGSRTLLLIGDSTNRQTSSTLNSMIRGDVPPGRCASQILSRDSDFLVQFDLIRPRPSMPERERGFIKHIHELRPDIVVLSTGAHYLDLEAYKSMLSALEINIQTIRRSYKKPPKFIWKTQNPGHYACRTGVKEKPLDDFSQFTAIDDHNKWNLHRAYDEVSKNLSRQVGMKVIDMSPLYLRLDGHPGYLAYDIRGGDCLHYCLPGPLNIFSILMTHLLRTELDVSGNDDDYGSLAPLGIL